jgi:DNA-binding NarL/FixJ family response regulator
MARLNLVVADDQALMRDALRVVLEGDDDFEIVGEAESGAHLVELLGRVEVDVAIVDLAMPPLDGLECLERIRDEHPAVTVIVLSATDDHRQIEAALRRGASAYVLKSISPFDMPAMIRQAVEGVAFVPLPTDASAPPDPRSALSHRELAVLAELARGRTNKDIATELWISEQTVKFHLRNIYRKLGISRRADALRFAHQHDVLGVRAA